MTSTSAFVSLRYSSEHPIDHHAKKSRHNTTKLPVKPTAKPSISIPISITQYLPSEMISLIASNLDMWDLIAAKQVCRAWYNVIDSTPHLWQHPHFDFGSESRRMRPPPQYVSRHLKGRDILTIQVSPLYTHRLRTRDISSLKKDASVIEIDSDSEESEDEEDIFNNKVRSRAHSYDSDVHDGSHLAWLDKDINESDEIEDTSSEEEEDEEEKEKEKEKAIPPCAETEEVKLSDIGAFHRTLFPTRQTKMNRLLFRNLPYKSCRTILNNLPQQVIISRVSVLCTASVYQLISAMTLLRSAIVRFPMAEVDLQSDKDNWPLLPPSIELTSSVDGSDAPTTIINVSPILQGFLHSPVPTQHKRCQITGGFWEILHFRDSSNQVEMLDLNNISNFTLSAEAPTMRYLRSLTISFDNKSQSVDVWSRVHLTLQHLKAPKLEILKLCFPPVTNKSVPKRTQLAKQWRLLIRRLPNLKEVTLSPVLPTSLSVLSEEESVRQGLQKLVLSGDVLPSTFLRAITPSKMPALDVLDVAGTAYNHGHPPVRRLEWQAAWENAMIACFKPPAASCVVN